MVLCDDLAGWDVAGWSRREAQEGGIYVFLQLIHVVQQKLK